MTRIDMHINSPFQVYQTLSLPDARPRSDRFRSDRFRRGGRESTAAEKTASE